MSAEDYIYFDFGPDCLEDEPYVVTCKYCGQPGLTWDEIEDNKWRLFEGDGNLHKCKEYNK